LKALIIIADYDANEILPKILSKSSVLMKVLLHGHGAADSKILDYLGLGEFKKAVVISVINDKDVAHAYSLLEHHLSISRAGHGIAFTIPISGASKAIVKAYDFIAEEAAESDKGEYDNMEANKYELIVTIAQRGSFDDIKETAKNSGARGGTLIHGLGMNKEEAIKFFGITIEPEKDIILIVVKKKDSSAIMKSILEIAGLNTKHRGVCFSLPVDSAFGLASKLDLADMKLE